MRRYRLLMRRHRLRLQINATSPKTGRRRPRWTTTSDALDAVRQLLVFYRQGQATLRGFAPSKASWCPESARDPSTPHQTLRCATYGTRQGWRHFKNDVVELWQYWCFLLEHRLHWGRPVRAPAWLLSKLALKGHGLEKFGEEEDVMYLPVEHPIFDPKNDHLFTAEAASKAFSHVELSGQEDAEISKQREGRLANIVIWGIALSMLIAFAAAVAAILFMKCPWHMNRLIRACSMRGQGKVAG